MSPDIIVITALLVILLVLVVYTLLQTKKQSSRGTETTAVLQERLDNRDEALGKLSREIADLQAELNQQRKQAADLRDQLTRQETVLQEERRQHDEKLALLNSAREQLKLEFSQLASDILDRKSKTFTDTSNENLRNILQPLQSRIQEFQKRVEDSYSSEARERHSLKNEIKNLQELNQRISEEALNLTRALKGDKKAQGTWGEVILERVLERSGLVKGREYDVQVSLKNEGGSSLQPDVIVHLPDQKDVIIDSKVSLVSYEQYCAEEDDEARAGLLKSHVDAIRAHIKLLSAKDYHKLDNLNTLDFVLMFLPVEAAFTVAVQEEPGLFSEAFDRNVMLVGPSNLLAILRTIQNIWRYEYQNSNAIEIAKRAGLLYDKFVSFHESLEEVGRYIDKSQAAHEQAVNQLIDGRGNLVGQVEKLKTLGARASKKIPDKTLKLAVDEDELTENGSDEADDD